MDITYRQTQSGKWLVCEAKPHGLGVGVQKVGTPSGGHTSGFQYGRFDTEAEAVECMNIIAAQRGYDIVQWIEPVNRNPQFIDLPRPDNDRISINSDKTIEWYHGEILKNIDITEGKWFGYDFALIDCTTGERLLLSEEGRYRVGDLKHAILKWRASVDERLGEVIPRGREGGRNPIVPDEPMRRHQIRINDSLWNKATTIGDGNVSDGIRQALDAWPNSE